MPTIAPVASIDPTTLLPWERAAIEEWVASARATGEDPVTCLEVPGCGVFLKGEAAEAYGEDLPCLAVFQDDLGNWSVLTRRPGRSGALVTCQFLGGRDVR